jgi:bacteriorhodopsin
MVLALATIIFLTQVLLYSGFLAEQGTWLLTDLGSCQPWARWVTYAFSCAILAYEIAGVAGMDNTATIFYVATIFLTLITGFFAAAGTELQDRWVWFGVGFAPYLISLILLFSWARWPLVLFVSSTWTLYPLILLLGPLYLGVISLTVESWLYLGADLLTKIGFEFWLVYQDSRQYDHDC